MLYFQQLRTFHPEIVRKYKGKECLCCNSVICNWKPTNKFEDIVSEVITNVNFMNSIYSNISFELRCANGGRLGPGPSLPWEICRLIRDYLVIQGIDPDRIKVISYGKEKPAVVGSNTMAWSKNRRAVTIID